MAHNNEHDTMHVIHRKSKLNHEHDTLQVNVRNSICNNEQDTMQAKAKTSQLKRQPHWNTGTVSVLTIRCSHNIISINMIIKIHVVFLF